MAARRGRTSSAIVVKSDAGGNQIQVARRKLGLKPASAMPISMLAEKLFGGKAAFMQFASLAVHIEPELGCIVEDYEKLPDYLRAAVVIDEICVKHQIDPLHFMGVVGEAVKKYGDNAAIIISSMRFPEVIQKTVKNALTPKGFKDRELLAKHHNFIPTPHGPSIHVNANAAARADAKAAPETKGLPSFERSMSETDDIVKDRE